MEDSFSVRVDKIFGSLSGGGGGGGGGDTASTAGSNPSLWRLTDEEIERRQWNRSNEQEDEEEEEDDESGPSILPKPLESDLQDLSDCAEEEEEEEEEEEIDGEDDKRRRSDAKSIADEDWDVKSNIGLDCTLDYEEEEDEYDKVAVGTKQTGDHIYMRDVKTADYGIDELDTCSELPISFTAVARDPRANHAAAKIRLHEDAEASGNLDTLQLSDISVTTNATTKDVKKKDGDNPKPILKKRETLVDSKSQKRVRFLCEPKSSAQDDEQPVSGVGDLALRHDGTVGEQVSDLSPHSSGVPDYLRNPAKYTRYTFDSSDDLDDQSNKQAFMDFFQQIRKRNTDSSPMDDTCDVSKSVTFIPKVKPEDDSIVKMSESEHSTEDNLKNKGWSIGVTAEGAQETEVSAMEEDEPCLAVDKGGSSQKPGRQYRARTSSSVEDNLA